MGNTTSGAIVSKRKARTPKLEPAHKTKRHVPKQKRTPAFEGEGVRVGSRNGGVGIGSGHQHLVVRVLLPLGRLGACESRGREMSSQPSIHLPGRVGA